MENLLKKLARLYVTDDRPIEVAPIDENDLFATEIYLDGHRILWREYSHYIAVKIS